MDDMVPYVHGAVNEGGLDLVPDILFEKMGHIRSYVSCKAKQEVIRRGVPCVYVLESEAVSA
jgi:hypothetical protein